MSMFTFNTAVPTTGHNPSQDYTIMQANNVSDAAIWNVDHIGYNLNYGGYHQQVRMPVESIPTVAAGFSGLYAVTAGQSQLAFTSDTGAKQYQLTRAIDASYATFGTNTNYSGSLNGGWTFLPGSLLLQYGIATSSGTGFPNTTVTLPVTMTNAPYSVNCTVITTSDSRFFVEVYDVSTNQFRAVVRDSGGAHTSGVQFYWQVIGS